MIDRRSTLSALLLMGALPQSRARAAGVRRVGLLMPYPASDKVVQARVAAFREAFLRLGWSNGKTVAFVEEWATDDLALIRAGAKRLVEAKVDVILTSGSRVMPIVKEVASTIPCVFAGTSDPVGQGIVKSLAQPGGNITGFSLLEFEGGRSPLIGELVEIVRQLRPGVRRVGMIFNADNPATRIHRSTLAELGERLGFATTDVPARTAADIEAGIVAFEAGGGQVMLFPSDLTLLRHRQIIVEAVARSRLVAVYSDPSFVEVGGLLSYSADRTDMFRRAASYVDQILKGKYPGDLPIQQPVRYEMAVNLRTAAALGITIPPSILIRADEVIE